MYTSARHFCAKSCDWIAPEENVSLSGITTLHNSDAPLNFVYGLTLISTSIKDCDHSQLKIIPSFWNRYICFTRLIYWGPNRFHGVFPGILRSYGPLFPKGVCQKHDFRVIGTKCHFSYLLPCKNIFRLWNCSWYLNSCSQLDIW